METRQATIWKATLSLLFLLSACSTPNEIVPTQTTTPPPSPTATATFTPSPIPPTFTPTPLACLTQPGGLKQESIPFGNNLQQDFLVYTPPCYNEMTGLHYPVLYLLHGQTYTQDQWVRLGVPQIADRLIHSGEAPPFIIVFPDDHYWNAEPGAGFGDRLIQNIIPYIDGTYRTIADRQNRSLGGLSRGGGWTVKLGLEYPELFGALGLHSPAVFKDNAPYVERLIKGIPEESRPQLWLDVGDADSELESIQLLENVLTRNDYFHEYHFFNGSHSEDYWGDHVEEYLRWYVQAWQEETVIQ
ncbi:MAG: esterase family protein [Anaerolineales bacterium]|nr:esterase family protein [Anaerolineales bacterium]